MVCLVARELATAVLVWDLSQSATAILWVTAARMGFQELVPIRLSIYLLLSQFFD